MLQLIVLLSIGIAPDACVEDYLIAVNGNGMGWFCARWDCGNREFEAKDQMDLYRKVAGDVLAGRVYDLRPWGNMRTVVIQADQTEVEAWVRKQFPKIPDALKRVGPREYEWTISPTSQGVMRSLLTAFPNKVSVGKRHP